MAQGSAEAAGNRGFLYHNGMGVPQSDEQAARLFKLAADGDQRVGLFNLANLYASGRGVTPDLAEAVRLYPASAEQGYAHAQQVLGSMY